jgi:hypothetical protein
MVTEKMTGWHPIHDNHAIAVMAAVVTFAQAIPDLLLKRVLQDSEDAAFGLGLKSRHAIRGFQIPVGIDATPQSGAVGAVQGQFFNALLETPDGAPPSAQIAEQLRVDQGAVVYRTWQYVSWKWQFERMRNLMAPALERAKSAVAFASIRLEYLDRFQFRGDATVADPKQLLRVDCPLIAPHVFSARDLWHSHTGSFLTTVDHYKRLQQVMIDAIDEPYPPQERVPPVRWVNITTALEDRLTPPLTADQEIDITAIFQTLDTLHVSLKDILSSIITEKLAKRICLREA